MPTIIDCICHNCNITFERTLSQLNRKKAKEVFCSQKCHIEHKRKNNIRVELKCTHCDKSFYRTPSGTKGKLPFCSQACNGYYYGSLKTIKTHNCKFCNNQLSGTKRICDTCKVDYWDPSIDDLKQKYSHHKHANSWHSFVRYRARNTVKHLPQICYECGYNRHVEVCHIKPIKDFSGESKLSVVNDIRNLVLLCPNHHWELDNQILSVGTTGYAPAESVL